MNDMNKMNPIKNKTTAAGVGGSIAVIVIAGIEAFTEVSVTSQVGAAIGVICSWLSALVAKHQ